MGRRALGSVLLGTLFFFAHAALAQVTEAEAHILSAFMTTADPGVFAEVVTVGPELRKDVGPEPEARELYQAIAARTAGRTLRVQFPSPAESASFRAIAGANPNDPFLTLDSGEMRFVFQYAVKQKRVGFVEQLGGEPLPRLAQRKRPALAKAPAAPQLRLPPVPEMRIDPGTPRGECVIKPVMSALDLWNCSGATAPAAPVDLPPPAVAAVPPAPPAAPEPPQARAECIIKPVMSDDDLRNCVGVTSSVPPVFPVAAAALVGLAPAAPPPGLARRECVIKPVMSDDELRNCANVPPSTPGVAAAAAPAPVAAVQAQASAPKPPAECIIKPVMSDQDLRNCANVSRSGGLLLIPIAAQKPAPAAPEAPPARPRPECVIKPVMSDDELRACGSRR